MGLLESSNQDSVPSGGARSGQGAGAPDVRGTDAWSFLETDPGGAGGASACIFFGVPRARLLWPIGRSTTGE